MLEVDPTVIHPEELVARVRRRLGKPVEAVNGAGAPVSAEATSELKQLDDNVRQLHAGWYPGEVSISSHRKLVGPALVFGKKAVRKLLKWYVDGRWTRQSDFNGAVTRTATDLARLSRSAQGQIAELKSEMAERENKLVERLTALESSHEAEIARLRHDVAVLVEHVRGEFGPIAQAVSAMREEQTYLASRVSKLGQVQSSTFNVQGSIDNLKPQTLNLEPSPSPSPSADIDYVLFENRFRGSREGILGHFAQFVPYFEASFEGRGRVLDIGCGRGEMIELLQARGVDVLGVDLDAGMVAFCADRGLPVVHADAIAYLQDQPDASLGGIFMSQVIEHLTTAQWAHFLDVARQKLRTGGCLIIETINPGSFFAMAHSFYKDLTHVRPVHPETLKFVAETKGYRETGILWLSTHPAVEKATDETRALAETVFGHMDYALVAHR